MFKTIKNYLLSFLELQLFISLVSLPIIIAWGLPVSSMMIIGNLMFTPLLVLFLWCSCLITLASLLHIPPFIFQKTMILVMHIWNYLLSLSNPSWLLGFPMEMIIPACIIICAVGIIYTVRYPRSKSVSVLILTLCTGILLGIRHLIIHDRVARIYPLPLYVIRMHNTTYLIDNGALCSKQNFYTWLDYSIIPLIIKKTGATTIDTLVLYKPHKNIVKIVQQCVKQLNIKKIIVTEKNDCYQKLKQSFLTTSIEIVPISKIKRTASKKKLRTLHATDNILTLLKQNHIQKQTYP